jgi:RNA polymerase sigma factor (sigma-70 family)
MGRRGASPAQIEAIYRTRFRAFLLSATAFLQDGEAAFDVVQEGFARGLRRRRSFRGEGSLEAWLWRIVLNVARDHRRLCIRPDPRRVETSSEVDYREDDLRASLLALPERGSLSSSATTPIFRMRRSPKRSACVPVRSLHR